jgi:3-deoxy-manno-octulosonate cytidylyltransferase (CMP-KDO synthetase)
VQEEKMSDFIVAIPSRFASTRLPGKPLQMIGDKAMIIHVAERALKAGASQVVIATDDSRIAEAVRIDSVTVCMTDAGHLSGTDRLAECADILGWSDQQIIVNLQGDEPFAPEQGIRQVAELLEESGCNMATLACPIENFEQFNNPNSVKVVVDVRGHALYFSRAPVPWPRDGSHMTKPEAMRHIGIYSYRSGFLKRFRALPTGKLESCESLEQLRVLENGFSIAVSLSKAVFPPGVDTAEDLAKARSYWQQQLIGIKS